MKRVLALVLFSVSLVTPYNYGAKKAAPAHIYYKGSPMLARIKDVLALHDAPDGQFKIAAVLDWDDVLAYQRGTLSSTGKIMGIFKLKETFSALRHNGRMLLRAARSQGLCDDNGVRLVGTGGNIRFLAQKIPAFNTHYDQIMEALGYARPIKATVTLFQKLQYRYDMPIIIWTNNDKEILDIKLRDFNKRLLNKKFCKDGPMSLMFQGAFYGGQQAVGVPEECHSVAGKPHAEYYEKALAYTKKIVGDTDGSWIYLFVDDRAVNINAARDYAAKSGAPIVAIQRINDKQLQKEVAFLLGE
jgi:hypothetical protein